MDELEELDELVPDPDEAEFEDFEPDDEAADPVFVEPVPAFDVPEPVARVPDDAG